MILVLCVCASASVHANEIEAALAATGKHHLEVPVGIGDQSTVLPVTVATGAAPGPTLLVLAGVHGSEYAPIMAAQRFGVALDPKELAGSVIIVHMANLPAYLGRTIYTSPVDGLNLNRLFPGDPSGSLSLRLAHVIATEIYPLADAVLDVHSGDGNEDLRPYWTGYYAQAGGAEVIAKSKAMAFAFGIQHVVPFQWVLKDRSSAIWAGSAAVALGIPSIDIEAGGRGIIDEDAIAKIEEGFHRIVAHLGISKQTYPTPENQRIIFDRESIKAPQDGSWVPVKHAGGDVAEGELLGYVTDLHGRKVFEARSPKDGLLMLILSAPPVRKGETLATIASTKAAESPL